MNAVGVDRDMPRVGPDRYVRPKSWPLGAVGAKQERADGIFGR
jgi:hypothetical protein